MAKSDKIDNFLTHNAWVIVIIAGLGWYYFGPLTAMISCIVVIFIWMFAATFRPSNLIGIIHYHNGATEKHGIFAKYSDYEEWADTMRREHGDEINYICYEPYIEEE